MERLAQSGNTYYIFDKDGEGASFTYLGRPISNVKYSNVSLSLRNIQNVHVLSILGMSGINKSDVFFDGFAGTTNTSYVELTKKAKDLSNMGFVPFRIPRFEEPGLMQVLYIMKPGSVTRDDIAKLLDIKEWRRL